MSVSLRDKDRKISKNIEKGKARKSPCQQGKSLIIFLFLLFVLFIHSRSHRFKSCIAHHTFSRNAYLIQVPLVCSGGIRGINIFLKSIFRGVSEIFNNLRSP
jgi:hypothetical protein